MVDTQFFFELQENELGVSQLVKSVSLSKVEKTILILNIMQEYGTCTYTPTLFGDPWKENAFTSKCGPAP